MQIATYDDAQNTLTIEAGEYRATITARQIEHHWNWSSFRPHVLAVDALRSLAARLNQFGGLLASLEAKGGKIDVAAEAAQFAQRQVSLHREYWGAVGRTASWFVTGPSNFPVRQQEKRQATRDRRYAAISEHERTACKAARRRAFPHGEPGDPIRSGNPDAPELLREKIEKAKAKQELMREANGIIRKHRKNPEVCVAELKARLGIAESSGRRLLEPDFAGRIGFPDYELRNNLANIKRMEARLTSIERMRARGTSETTAETAAGVVQVIEDVDAARIQLVFPDKPSPDIRSILKSHGFRWAPSSGAWQRHLNQAGRDAAEIALAKINNTADA